MRLVVWETSPRWDQGGAKPLIYLTASMKKARLIRSTSLGVGTRQQCERPSPHDVPHIPVKQARSPTRSRPVVVGLPCAVVGGAERGTGAGHEECSKYA